MQKITRERSEIIAGQINVRPGKHDVVQVIAAACDIAAQVRGGRPESMSYWTDAVRIYMSRLPQDDEEAALQVARDASISLNEPRILEFAEAKVQAARKVALAESELRRAEQAPLNAHLNDLRSAAARERRETINSGWNRNWLAEIDAAKAILKTTYEAYLLQPSDHNAMQRVANAQTAIVALRLLKEIAEEDSAPA